MNILYIRNLFPETYFKTQGSSSPVMLLIIRHSLGGFYYSQSIRQADKNLIRPVTVFRKHGYALVDHITKGRQVLLVDFCFSVSEKECFVKMTAPRDDIFPYLVFARQQHHRINLGLREGGLFAFLHNLRIHPLVFPTLLSELAFFPGFPTLASQPQNSFPGFSKILPKPPN